MNGKFKAVILAAGVGSRLRPIIEKIPKGLIEIKGKTLLEYSLAALKENGIQEVIIVIGFLAETIKEKFGEEYKGIKIEYVLNNEYSRTASMYSFSRAEDAIGNRDVILLESDLLYDPKAINILLNSVHKDCIMVSGLSGSGDEVYVRVDDDQRVIELSKNVSESNKKDTIGEFIGVSRYSKDFLDKLFKKAEEDYRKDELNYEYDECVIATSKLGNPIYAIQCKNLSWTEIDNKNDLKRAKEKVYPKIKRKKC